MSHHKCRLEIVAKVVFLIVALIVTGGASAQTATYSLGTSSDLLDADFYNGMAAPGSAVVEAASGRGILNIGVNNAGTTALFWGYERGAHNMGLFTVNIGDPSSWERVSIDEPYGYRPIVWLANDIHAFVGPNRLFNTTTNVLKTDHELSPGFTDSYTGMTRKASDNWVVGHSGFGEQVMAFPILSNGQLDTGRTTKTLTNFTLNPTEDLVLPTISRDGNELLLTVNDPSVIPDIANVYRLTGVNDILNDVTLPPTSLGDPRIVEIRASATPNWVGVPQFSFDGTLAFTSEDHNNQFDIQDFFATLALADWGLNISNSDGTGFVSLNQAGSQGNLIPFPTGNRLTYVEVMAAISDIHAYATTLIVESNIDTETDPIPGDGTNDTIVNGNPVTVPFILTDSVVATTVDVTIEDASGTVVELPADQVINFPDGTITPEITIFTPVDPVAPIELPDPEISIPVIRTFGPAGTEFFPPITVTITYTDAEVANLENEADMVPYLFNQGTGEFEPLCGPAETACLTAIVVDTVNNTLTFQIDHFSTYGVGGKGVPVLPQRPWAIYFTAFAIAMLAARALAVCTGEAKL